MGLTMSERKAVLRQTFARYQKACKKEKGRILDEFVKLTGLNRKYASWVLTTWGKKRYCWVDGRLVRLVVGAHRKKKRKPKARIYDGEVFKALRKVWYIFDCPCGRRLARISHKPIKKSPSI